MCDVEINIVIFTSELMKFRNSVCRMIECIGVADTRRSIRWSINEVKDSWMKRRMVKKIFGNIFIIEIRNIKNNFRFKAIQDDC